MLSDTGTKEAALSDGKGWMDLGLLKYICAHLLPGPSAFFLKEGQKIPQVPSDR